MATATINGIQLYYEVHGQGRPLLLIAGLASDGFSWRSIIRPLAQHYQVIVFDNRGVGRTQPADQAISIQQITDDGMALINHLGFSSTSLLGHSMGGFVAQDWAIRYPEWVDQLILVGTSTCSSERNNFLYQDWINYLESGMSRELWFRSLFYWFFSSRLFQDREILEGMIEFAIAYPYAPTLMGFKHQVRAIAEFNSLPKVAQISAKTLVISGKEDILVPPEASLQLAQLIPQASWLLIPDTAHSIQVEIPQIFATQVMDFLSQG